MSGYIKLQYYLLKIWRFQSMNDQHLNNFWNIWCVEVTHTSIIYKNIENNLKKNLLFASLKKWSPLYIKSNTSACFKPKYNKILMLKMDQYMWNLDIVDKCNTCWNHDWTRWWFRERKQFRVEQIYKLKKVKYQQNYYYYSATNMSAYSC